MSDKINSSVSDTQGGVHAGSGDQHIYINTPLTDSAGRSPRKQAEDDLRWLARRFIYPAGLGRARDILESHRTVFLDARPGSGRIAAAEMLLHELRSGSGTIHELLIQEKHERSSSPLDLSHIGDGDRAWLDLHDTRGWSWTEIQDELPGLRHAVHERAAYLVVVLSDAPVDLQSFGQYRVMIGGPSVHDVLRQYLRTEGISVPDRLPDIPFLHEGRPLGDIPTFVQLIVEARARAAGSGEFVDWCGIAYQALSGREKEVAASVTRLTLGRQRALLLATAMLHGAHADCVHSASASLLEMMEHPLDQSPVLEQEALDQRLSQIGAEPDDRGNVRFREIGYDSAVRAYFWTHMPELRDPIRRWVGSIIDMAGLTEVDRENLIARFAEQCLSLRYQPAWMALVQQCTDAPTNVYRMRAAALVLQRGLRNEQSSRNFRRQIYEWSRNKLSIQFAEVIIAACRDEMIVSHPDEALVRLHHVARRERGTRAFETIVTLAGSDRRFLRQMLGRLVARDLDAWQWPADIGLFLKLVDPAALTESGVANHPLIAESTVRRQLADGWKLAFTNRQHADWSPAAEKWIRWAADDARNRHALLDVLIEGSEQRIDIVARLYKMTRRQEFPGDFSDLLLVKTSPLEMS